jgi:hypothetical protein
MRSGKSTASQYYINSYKAERISFGEPIKNMLRALGLNEEEINGSLKETPTDKLGGQSPRFAMQRLGDDWGRNMMHPKFWIIQIGNLVQPGKVYVFDDIRKPNEAEFIKSKGGTVIKIERPSLVSSESHSSETSVDSVPFDHRVINDGSIESLHKKLELIEI